MNFRNTFLLFFITGGTALVSCNRNNGGSNAAGLSIRSIKPNSGTSHVIVTLTGGGFSTVMTDDSVFFNGKIATVLSATGGILTVSVPTGAGSGNVSVKVKGDSAVGPIFTYTGDSLYLVSTFAGNGSIGVVDGTGLAAVFNLPGSIALDANGNLYVGDMSSNDIRKITSAGVVTTFAGSGKFGSANGVGTAASFSQPDGVAIDAGGNVYVTEWDYNDIRKITIGGVVSTFAGAQTPGYVDAVGTAARFNRLSAIAVDGQNNAYVGDFGNYRIRKITAAGVVSTFVGTGTQGSTDGTGISASIGGASGMCTDAANNIYFTDHNCTIRKITPAGVVTTLAGTSSAYPGYADGIGLNARFGNSSGVTVDKYGNIYVADANNEVIRKITPMNVVTTIAGIPGTFGSKDGPGNTAGFATPNGIVVDANGNIYVADTDNHKIRRLTPM